MSEKVIVVKGLCYEDLISILTTNGYDVRVEAHATKDALKNTYILYYKPHDYTNEVF